MEFTAEYENPKDGTLLARSAIDGTLLRYKNIWDPNQISRLYISFNMRPMGALGLLRIRAWGY
jgi:hypothetical protein